MHFSSQVWAKNTLLSKGFFGKQFIASIGLKKINIIIFILLAYRRIIVKLYLLINIYLRDITVCKNIFEL